MNVVFWLIVVVVLAAVWLALSSSFREIGDAALRLWGDVKDEMSDDNDDDSEENFENEGEESEDER